MGYIVKDVTKEVTKNVKNVPKRVTGIPSVTHLITKLRENARQHS